jgi:hypothetical protein
MDNDLDFKFLAIGDSGVGKVNDSIFLVIKNFILLLDIFT